MKDLLLEEANDFKIANGDIAVGESTIQNQQLIIMSNAGEWKRTPTVGVGIEQYLDDDTVDELFSAIRQQLTADGQKVKTLKTLPNGHLAVEAS